MTSDSAVFSPSKDADGASRGEFSVTVNGALITLRDRRPIGRQILTAAGLLPATDYVLIQLLKPGTKSISVDETLNLGDPGREAFRAFKTDRIFLFTVDEVAYEWGNGSIEVAELRRIAVIPDDRVLVLERLGEDAQVIHDHVTLAAAGTEHLRTASRLVAVFLDDEREPRLIPRGTHTTEELLTLLKVKPGYQLNVLGPDGQINELAPGQKVHVKEGMHFYSQAPAGGAS